MVANLLQLGMSGLRTSQKQLDVTGHNIANVNTPGYSRQRVEQHADTPQWQSGHYHGTGSYIDNVSRAYDQFAAKELTHTTTQLSNASTKEGQLMVMDEFISSNGSKTVSSMNDFYDAVKSLADQPNDLGSRQAVLENGKLVADALNSTHASLSVIHEEVNDQLTAQVDSVNALGQELATLNKRIMESPAGEMNDLYDQQRQLINELAQYTNVTVLEGGNSLAQNVIIGSGHTLVSADQTSTFKVIPGDPDIFQKQVAYVTGNNERPVRNSDLGGSLGALLSYRDDVVVKSLDEVGRMAIGYAGQVNELQRQGIDLSGEQGANFYRDINDPIIQQQRVIAPFGSSSEVAVAINDVNKLKTGDYSLTSSFDAVSNAYVYNLSDAEGATYQQTISATEPQQIELDGMQINITTPPSEGEKLLLRPVRSGAGDIAVNLTDARQIAAQSYVTPAPTNVGNADIEKLPTAQASGSYTVQVNSAGNGVSVLDSSGNAVNLVDRQGNTVQTLNYPISGDTIHFAGALGAPIATLAMDDHAAAGDSYTVDLSPPLAVGDNSNLMKMQFIQSDKTMNGGKSTVIDLFEGLATDIGIEKMNAEKMSEISSLDHDAAVERVGNVSGVNLDEEAANLMKFQQAYMASSRIMTVAQETFDTLMRAI